MDGYYEPHARVALEQPLVLCGLLGAGLAQAGLALAGLTGLPLRLVGRSVEHVAGRSRARIAVEDGLDSLHERETEQLERALRQGPPALLVAPEGAHLPARAAAVAATWIYLARPADELVEGLHRQHSTDRGSIPGFVIGPPVDPADLWQRVAGQDRDYRERVDRVIDCAGAHAHGVARLLIEALGWTLAGASRPGRAPRPSR